MGMQHSLHVEEQQGVQFAPVGDEKGDEHRGDRDEGERDFSPQGSFPQQPDDGGRDDEEVEVARDVPRLEHALQAENCDYYVIPRQQDGRDRRFPDTHSVNLIYTS
jgi:hypothetical protein